VVLIPNIFSRLDFLEEQTTAIDSSKNKKIKPHE